MKKQRPQFRATALALVLAMPLFTACGGSSSGTAATSDLGTAGAMVAAAFSGDGAASINDQFVLNILDAFVQTAHAQVENDTCSEGEGSPSNVTNDYSGAAGTYGSADNSVTLTEDDFCEDAEGNANSGEVLYAAFELSSGIVTCDDGTDATMEGSGVFRNDNDAGHYPKVYGSFTITIDGVASEADCSIFINEDGTVDEASCSTTEGEDITIETGVTCSIDAG